MPRFRFGAWHLSALVVAICLGIWGYLEWSRRRVDTSDEALYRRMPSANAVQVYLNVQAMRQAGLLEMLAGSKAMEELDYREFVKGTGFDYKQDLDSVFGSFYGDKSAFLLRGRFDWEQIRKWAKSQGADCLNGYCGMETRKPNRYVSFFALYSNVMALAISDSTGAAYTLQTVRAPEGPLPKQPFWVLLPASLLNSPDSLPTGTRAFASAVKGAERVTLGVGPGGDAFEAQLEAQFKSAEEAAQMRGQLEKATGMLKKFFSRDQQTPNPNDLSGVLTAGSFSAEGGKLVGRWPIKWEFLAGLAEGKK